MKTGPRLKSMKKTGNYKGVFSGEVLLMSSGQSFSGVKFGAQIVRNGKNYKSRLYDTEREAALWYDKKLIEFGEQPVNILKPKPSQVQ